MPGTAIVCEKPLVEFDDQLDRVAELLTRGHVWVNFIRHWVPGIRGWAQRAAAGELGAFLGGRAFYTKGLRNNGTHLLALLAGFTPAVRSVQCTGVLQDQRGEDLSAHFTLHYDGGCALSVTALNHAYLGHLSADLCFSTGRLRIDHGGAWVHWAPIRSDPMYPGYQSLGDETTFDTGLDQHFVELYARVAKHLRGEIDEPSNLESAIRVSRLIAEILPLGNKGETR
jgi:predicted dehydrogenase